ncbi:hypothetical protein [Bacillus tuaregi]|uniref:hypothetical protein n=1 Tax=Bacillus tuaregi TaxID=1816695 RepID=UPI0008F82E9C|nr:hypothetical protein [Bacillus tuaregi]
MNMKRNQHGYALLTTLLVSTLLIFIAFTFFGQSVNTVKQNKIVETNSQSVALAEMGVNLVEYKVRNIYESNKSEIIKQIQLTREEDIKNNRLLSNEVYIQKAVDETWKLLNDKIKKDTDITLDDKASALIRIEKIYFTKKEKELDIDFTISGIENAKAAKISTDMSIDFSQVMTNNGNNPSNPPSNGGYSPILTGTEIPDPGQLDTCNSAKSNFTNEECQIEKSSVTFGNDLTLNDSIFKVIGKLIVGNMNNDIKNSTLFITGDLQTGQMNSMNQLLLHVGGDATIGNLNGNGLTDSTIEIIGEAQIGNVKMKNTTMYIGNKATINGKTTIDGNTIIGNINGMEDSTIYIDSIKSTTIAIANLGKNSTLCVTGPLTIGNININRKDTNSNVYAKSSMNSDVITDEKAFKNACGKKSAPTPPPVAWGTPEINISYRYDYDL